MEEKVKYVTVGRTEILYNTILTLNARGYPPSLIVTGPAENNYSKKEADFEKLAGELGVPFFCTNKISDLKHTLQSISPDIAVSINWMRIIPPEILNIFEHGIVNFHIGDLPKYRGNATPNWAIINNEPYVVLTIHKMDAGLDTGDILLQERYEIKKNTTIGEVYDFALKEAPKMFVNLFNDFSKIVPKKQMGIPLRCYPRRPEDSKINWRETSKDIHNLIRASSEPLGGAYTFFKDKKMIVWRSDAEKFVPYLAIPGQVLEIRTNGDIAIATGKNALILKDVEVDGVRNTPASFIKSLRDRLTY